MIRGAVQEAASGRDAAAWRRLLDLLTEPGLAPAQLRAEVAWLRGELAEWPVEVSRPPPGPELCDREPVLAALRPLVRVVREGDLYPLYVERVCTSPRLLLHDGSQAVRLARAFTGQLAERRIGQAGQGDLVGGLCVEFWRKGPPPTRSRVLRRVEVRLEIEVKVNGGRVREAQENRRRSFDDRGALYLVVHRIADAIDRLCTERDRLVRELESD